MGNPDFEKHIIVSFTRYHILGIMLSLTVMAFSFFELLWIKLMFLGITIIKNNFRKND